MTVHRVHVVMPLDGRASLTIDGQVIDPSVIRSISVQADPMEPAVVTVVLLGTVEVDAVTDDLNVVDV